MITYYGYTISPNQIETGEGFLICRNVPIARTGEQDYLGSEIGLDTNDIVKVLRFPEEVFSEAAMASFEGKPVTNEHPPDLLDPDNVMMFENGHAQNIRKGTGEWDGYLIADLHIHDGELIRAVQNGKREISCGYECEYTDNGDGTYSQKNIRGNHVAVVEHGRAGKRAAILDSNKNLKQAEKPPERKSMKKSIWKLLGLAAEGKSAEEISQMAMDTADAMEGESKAEPKPEGREGKQEETKDESAIDESVIDAIVDKVVAKMAAKKAEEEKAPGADDDPIETIIKALSGGDGEEAHVVPAEEMDKTACGMDKALAGAILKEMRPVVAAIKDEAQRKAVSDALIKCVTTDSTTSDIAKIMQAVQDNAKTVDDRKPQMDIDAIQAAYDKMNPHRKEK